MSHRTSILRIVLFALAAIVPACRTHVGRISPQAPSLKPAGIPLEEQILGYWAPDWEAMAPKWKPMIQGLAQLQLGDRSPAARARAEKKVADEMKEGFSVITMEFTKDKFLQHKGPGRVEEQSCMAKSSDPKTGTLEVEMSSSHGGAPERGKIVLAGDRLIFDGVPEKQSAPWILVRISKREFEKRQSAAAGSKLFNAGIKYQPPYNPPGHKSPRPSASKRRG